VLNEGPALKSGDAFQLFTAPSFGGSFASLLLPPLGYDLMWDTSGLMVDGTIRVASASSQDHPVISLTPGTFHQQILGLGGNFCQGEQNALVAYCRFDEMFGPDGLNMSFIRISTAHELAEPGFANFDANNVTTVHEFRARQPNGRVMLTTWTPPESLKTTHSPYKGTLAMDGSGNYRYADYAAWWTRALQFYQNQSAFPDYVSIQNEPDFTPTPPSSGSIPAYIAGCYLNQVETPTRAGYPQALAAVKNAFSAAGFGSMKMIGPDTTAIGGDKIPNYLANLPAASLHGIAHHLYHDRPASTGAAALARLNSQYPWWTTPKFMTELNPYDTYEPWPDGQPGWMQLAATIHNVLTIECANTYMVWSSMWGLVDRFTGLPNNANYHALAHFSRFVNANNWRVAASSSDPEVLVSHYRHYGGPGISDRQIIVMINLGASPKHSTVGTDASWSSTPAQRFWQVHQTADDGSVSKRVKMTELDQGPWLSGNRQLVLPPHSITTALLNTGSAASKYTHHQVWRFQHFGTMDNTGNAADAMDSDNDGETNFHEFASGQNPFARTRATPSMVNKGSSLEFTYTRSKAAVLDGVTFTVEWIDDLSGTAWSSAGIANQNPSPLAQTATTETLEVLIPAGIDRRFVRLRMVGP
jgi:O-glycosyl hydrolase